jgi:hypothetical protein
MRFSVHTGVAAQPADTTLPPVSKESTEGREERWRFRSIGFEEPADIIVTPSDFALVAKARKRGGEKAADRVADALARRIVKTQAERDTLREQLMRGDTDHAWLPKFLAGK